MAKIEIHRSEDRGRGEHDWLHARHSFSFADYHNPKRMSFGTLRVLNEDVVEPGQGFGMHGHDNMEIVTIVLEGALEHKDSEGNHGVIRPGDVQRMSAGTGIRHSEFNPSDDKPTKLLQIWLLPNQKNVTPSYEQTAFPESERRGKLRLVASPDGRDGSVTIHQDVALYASLLKPGEKVEHALADKRVAWVQVARGELTVNGISLKPGDGAAVTKENALELIAAKDAEILLFDMPSLN